MVWSKCGSSLYLIRFFSNMYDANFLKRRPIIQFGQTHLVCIRENVNLQSCMENSVSCYENCQDMQVNQGLHWTQRQGLGQPVWERIHQDKHLSTAISFPVSCNLSRKFFGFTYTVTESLCVEICRMYFPQF